MAKITQNIIIAKHWCNPNFLSKYYKLNELIITYRSVEQ